MEINRNNYETFFLLYLDRELNPTEMLDVEKFLSENTDLQNEFALLQRTIFVPAQTVFGQKELLFHKEEKRRIIPIYWMRVAAAVVVLFISSWLITTQLIKNHGSGIARSPGTKNVVPAEKKSSDRIIKSSDQLKKEENHNATDLSEAGGNKNQPADLKKIAATQNKSSENSGQNKLTENSGQNKSSENSGTAIVRIKSENDLPGKNNQDLQKPSANPDQRNPSSAGDPDGSNLTVQKSSTLELQSEENQSGPDAKKIAAMPRMQAPVLLVASANTAEHVEYENAVLRESDYQTDNAISVLSLNNNNKGITGFFKKLTKPAPAGGNARKVRVSVFQFSY